MTTIITIKKILNPRITSKIDKYRLNLNKTTCSKKLAFSLSLKLSIKFDASKMGESLPESHLKL